MPYVPLKLPPGVRRNGTLYQAKGRWYSADLVRWWQDTMQPIGGWERFNRNDGQDVAAAVGDDGTVFTDYTTAANNATVGDVVLLPAVPVADDAFYIGLAVPFGSLSIAISTAGVGGTVVWEYYNGTSWVSLSDVEDNTVGFTAAPATVITAWTPPSDWATTSVNSQGPFYYVRARVTSAGSSGGVGSFIDIGSTPIYLGEPIRGVVGWKDNDQNSWLGAGTPAKLYAVSGSFVYDITPAGFTTGTDDSTSTVGQYGDGAYGAGVYGTGDSGAATVVEAQSWQLDTFGEDLVAVAYSDGLLYYFDVSAGGGSPATVFGGEAPIENVGLVVSPERFIVALGGRGQVTGVEDAANDARRVVWSDQEDHTVWDPDAAGSQAGDFILSGAGELMCGARNRNETLLWTDVDLFSMRYIGGTLVYSFQQVGAQCGIISRRAKAVVDGRAFWMGSRTFFMYDGYAKPIRCEIADDVFNNINLLQKSKITAWSVSEYNEIWFSYPSVNSVECDTMVCYNYVEGHWSGPWNLERTDGFDRGPFDRPMGFDSLGQIYYHEVGENYDTPDRATDLIPNAESGPFEIGAGDKVMTLNRIIPDENSLGDIDATLYAALYPTASEDSQIINTLTEPTSCRLTGRQIRLKVAQDSPGWRVGTFRLEVIPRGRR